MAGFELSEQQMAALVGLCRKYAVRHLALFGSAAAGGFVLGKSDLDFVADFAPPEGMGLAEQFFGFWDELKVLFEMDVDLVERTAVRNPFFLKAMEATEVTVFAA